VVPRIIVVDDEPSIRRTLRAVLEVKGYDITEADCGREALRLIHSGQYDLVLLDINMPDITGIEVCREVRTTSQIPIVMMSAGEENKARSLEAGANDYLRKPFGMAQVFSLVKLYAGEIS
jgi:DNA-binding response OmpR family regulator